MSRRLLHPARMFWALALLLAIPADRLPAAAPAWQDLPIGQVLLLDDNEKSTARLLPYRPLIVLHHGEKYRYRDVRQSIENLNRTGVFAGIEVKVQERQDPGLLDVLFILQAKPRIRALEFTGKPPLGEKEMRAAIFSLRQGELFEESLLPKALEELQSLFRSKGYFNAQASPRVFRDGKRSACSIQFIIAPGKVARIRRLQVDVDDPQLAGIIRGYFRPSGAYIPDDFAKGTEKARKLLKKHLYYFPEIKVQEDFLDAGRTALNLNDHGRLRFQVSFRFSRHGRPDAADRRRLGTAGL